MGTFKKFNAALSMQTINTRDVAQGETAVPEYKDTNGNTFTGIWARGDSSSYMETFYRFFPYVQLTPVATNDVLSAYDVNDYQVNGVGTTTFTKTTTSDYKANVYNITVNNSGSTAISVSCVKFVKPLGTNFGADNKCLVYGYYLDTPLSIASGESETIMIKTDYFA